ncbi:MAG: haloacid dehalogenase-like hydrolase, partial [Ignavibacteria bacterium]|nr:haloacid dehalogenase-like hydrolase [Ignavibacteria bacterium]
MSLTSLSLVDDLLQNHLPPGNSEPPLCVFDCDGTIIHGDIGEAMLFYQLEHFLFRESPARIWADHPHKADLDALYRALRDGGPGERAESLSGFADMVLSWYFDQLDEMKTAKACADIVRLFAGYSLSEVQEIARQTLSYELASVVGTRTLGSRTVGHGIRFIAESMEFLNAVRARGFDVWVVSGSNRWSVEAVCSTLGVPP